jgi:protein TonB
MPPSELPKPVEVVYQVEPSYTQEAREAKLEGTVLVSFDVLADGTPTNLQVVEGLGKGLDEKALEALSQFRFKPALLNGVASKWHTSIRMHFSLEATRAK